MLGNSVFIFLNRFFNNIASLLVIYFYAHGLQTIDYGHYQAFWVQLNIFNVFAGLGIAIFSLTYSPSKIRLLISRIRPGYYGVYAAALLIGGILFGLLQAFNNLVFPWPVLFLILFVLCNITDALLVAFRQFKWLVAINFLYSVFFFGIHYVFIVRSFDFNLLIAWLIPLLFLKLSMSSLILSRHSRQINFQKNTKDDPPKSMMSLWRHLYFYDILLVASLWADKFFISLFMNPKETAVYINGTLNLPFLPLLFSALTGAALIHLSNSAKEEDRLWTVNYISKVLSSVVFPIVIFLSLFRSEFVIFFFSEKYLEAIPIFVVYIMIIPFRAYGHTILLQNMEQGRIINHGAILDVAIALTLMLPLYHLFGLPGVALAFVISTFFQALYYGFQTRRLLHTTFSMMYPFRNWMVKMVIFLFIGLILYYGLPMGWPDGVRLLVGGSIMGLCSLLVLFRELRNYSPDIGQSIN